MALLPEEEFEVQARPRIIADAENPTLTGDPWLDREELELHGEIARDLGEG